jgi:biopolymer transport protein ExbD
MENNKQIGRKQARDARDKKEDIDIDMNPMVDLAFLLLTFFMLTTTLSRPHAMELVLPANDNQEVETPMAIKESKTLTLVPGSKDKLYYYQGITNAQMKELSLDGSDLKALLSELKAQTPDLMVFIKPHPDCTYGNVVQLLDDLNTSELTRYAFDKFGEFEQTLLDDYDQTEQ